MQFTQHTLDMKDSVSGVFLNSQNMRVIKCKFLMLTCTRTSLTILIWRDHAHNKKNY